MKVVVCCICCFAILSSALGMVNILHGLGLRLLVLGYHTPFVVRAWQGMTGWGCGMGVAGMVNVCVWPQYWGTQASSVTSYNSLMISKPVYSGRPWGGGGRPCAMLD